MSERVLKFRAWDIKNQIMRHTIINIHWLISGEPISCEWMVSEAEDGVLYNKSGWVGGVDEFILEQFTGKFDKNGKEVYEGDRLLVTVPDTQETSDWRSLNDNPYETIVDDITDMAHLPQSNWFEIISTVHDDTQEAK